MTLKAIALHLGWAAACLGFLPTGAAAQDALKRIAEHGQVNVGYSEDAPPFSFKDSKGAPSGYSLDFCMAIVNLLRERTKNPNLRLNLVPVSTDQLPRLMGSRGIDLMCAGVSDTKARRSTMDFSSP
ncbi:MAG: transporter substrate-binding domain-containing protein, partial [Ramlibacter sp.]